jgi:hypothetical protein
MALIINASGKYLSRTTNLPQTTPMSITFWAKPVVDNTNDYQGMLYLGATPADDNNFRLPMYYSGVPRWRISEGNGDSYPVLDETYSLGTWYYVAFSADEGVEGCHISIQREGSTESFVTWTRKSWTPDTFTFGAAPAGPGATDDWGNFRYLALKVWDAVLSDAELTAEKFYYDPQHSANVNGWYPLITGSSDHSVNGYDWAEVGSLSYTADEPTGMNPLGGPAGDPGSVWVTVTM